MRLIFLLWVSCIQISLSQTEKVPGGQTVAKECKPCDQEVCPVLEDCLAGYTTDRCGCCQVCGRSEFELCDVSGVVGKYGVCGENLECKLNYQNQYACSCLEQKLVCGSDSKTYETICSLNEESMRRGKPDSYNTELHMVYWGPCKEAPIIITPPADSYGPMGANLTLDCEARGHPAPTITWQFQNSAGKIISLPSDDQSIAIQMRGGPEPMMVSSWAQIMALDPNYIGTYHCVASNSEGKVYAFANVGVYKEDF